MQWRKTSSKIGFNYSLLLNGRMGEADFRLLAAEQLREIRLLENEDADPVGWFSVVFSLPLALRQVLIQQLERGNLITVIGGSGWPNENSIVVNMMHRFGVTATDLPPEVGLQIVNDPRQWLENISQIVDGQEHMLMA